MSTQLDLKCPCKGPLFARSESAAHDEQLIDVVVECKACGRTLNSFISIDEMLVLDEGSSCGKENPDV